MKTAALSAALPFFSGWPRALAANSAPGLLKPPGLAKGQTIGLVTPASAVPDRNGVENFGDYLQRKGFKVKMGQHVFDSEGYLAGTDQERAADINRMFADPEVDAIIAVRGGWGGARILPLLDYRAISQNPKILLGYSDVTSLLLGIHAKTGLVTFHGPVGLSDWNCFTRRHFRRVLMKQRTYKLRGGPRNNEDLLMGRYTITPGKASGKLLGGNLTVMCGLAGSDYLPDFTGAVLLLEDVGEAVYRLDRFLTQLSLAGILQKVSAVVFSTCNDCQPEQPKDNFTLREVLVQHLQPLGVPAFYGTRVGHIEKQYTLPIGARIEINASRGHIKLLEPAVS